MSEEAGDLGFGVLGVAVRSPPRLWLPDPWLRFSLLIACHEAGPGKPHEGSHPSRPDSAARRRRA